MTTIISLFGGPGTGKSISAAFIWRELKMSGHSAELVREVLKTRLLRSRVELDPYERLHYLGEQIRAESELLGKVDYLVTDAPILSAEFYAGVFPCTAHAREAIETTVRAFYAQAHLDGHRHLNFRLARGDYPYEYAGRTPTEMEARGMDRLIEAFLSQYEGFTRTPHYTDDRDLRKLIQDALGR